VQGLLYIGFMVLSCMSGESSHGRPLHVDNYVWKCTSF